MLPTLSSRRVRPAQHATSHPGHATPPVSSSRATAAATTHPHAACLQPRSKIRVVKSNTLPLQTSMLPMLWKRGALRPIPPDSRHHEPLHHCRPFSLTFFFYAENSPPPRNPQTMLTTSLASKLTARFPPSVAAKGFPFATRCLFPYLVYL